MEKPYYKAVILAMASDNLPIYKFFKAVQESYMFEHPHFKFYFTYAGKIGFEPKEYDLVYPELKETITPPWSTRKVIRAMRDIDACCDYDFLIRTNLSTIWDLSKLHTRLQTLPTTGHLSGRLGMFPPPFVVGQNMTISRDLIKQIIQNEDTVCIPYPKYVPEDRMISEFFTNNLGVKLVPADKTMCVFEERELYDYQKILAKLNKAYDNGCDHYRVKSLGDRNHNDPRVCRDILSKVYGITLDLDQMTKEYL